MRFEILTPDNMKMSVLWDVTLFSLVEIDGHFIGAFSPSFIGSLGASESTPISLHQLVRSIQVSALCYQLVYLNLLCSAVLFISLIMVALSAFEASVNLYQTRQRSIQKAVMFSTNLNAKVNNHVTVSKHFSVSQK